MNTFNPRTLGCTAGVLWGLALFLTALGGSFFPWGHDFILVFSSVYIGYAPTFVGAVVGLFWGLVDGFICGFIFAWLYNCCLKCGFCRGGGK